MMKRIRMLATTGLVTASLQALALGAGQDASDCHHISKAGLDRCQRAQRVRIELPPPAAPATMDTPDARTASTAPQAASPCRGITTGVYTMTSTGRINGSGC
jgi:hypothetical protein